MRKKTDLIVLHCSASRPSDDTQAKDIDRQHRKQGWLKIGYHFVITRDGVLQTGRHLDEVGAHVAGFNHRSIGICLSGGVKESDGVTPENNFTPAQWTVLSVLLAELRESYPQAKVAGHYELNPNKACPSFDVNAYRARMDLN